jgi:hypothetical protein
VTSNQLPVTSDQSKDFVALLKLAFRVGRAFQPAKIAARVADPDSFGHLEMTALLNRQKFHFDTDTDN